MNRKRIETIDVIRGLALFGILLVNIQFFGESYQSIADQWRFWPGFWNQAVQALMDFGTQGGFLAMFAFLFGYSTMLFRENVPDSEFRALYVRRLAILAEIGVIHGLFVWYGDILLHYAILGIVFLIFTKSKPSALLILAFVCLAIVPAIETVTVLSSAPSVLNPDQRIAQVATAMIHDQAVYATGNWLHIEHQRIRDWADQFATNLRYYYAQILGMFLLGAYFAKRAFLNNPSTHKRFLRATAMVCLAVGVLATTINLLAVREIFLSSPQAQALAVIAGLYIGGPCLGVGLITLLGWLQTNWQWRQRLSVFSAIGKTSLTNYIVQSLVCTTIFYGYGFGMFGRIPPTEKFGIVVVLYGLQVVASRWWLKRFFMGPLEWVWRLGIHTRKPPVMWGDGRG